MLPFARRPWRNPKEELEFVWPNDSRVPSSPPNRSAPGNGPGRGGLRWVGGENSTRLNVLGRHAKAVASSKGDRCKLAWRFWEEMPQWSGVKKLLLGLMLGRHLQFSSAKLHCRTGPAGCASGRRRSLSTGAWFPAERP